MNARMHRLDLGLYTHLEDFFFGMESKPILKNPLYRRVRGGSHPRRCIRQNSTPNTLPTELFRPPDQESNPKPPVLETNAFPTEPSSRCLGSTARRRCAGDQRLPHRAIQPVPWFHGPSSLCRRPTPSPQSHPAGALVPRPVVVVH